MGRLNKQRAPLVFGLILAALLLAMGCKMADQALSTSTPDIDATAIASPVEVTRPTAVPRFPTPLPTGTRISVLVLVPTPILVIVPEPTPVIVTQECVVGLRLEPGEGCEYFDGAESDFVLTVREDGATLLDGSVGPLTLSEQITRPGAKVCACGLETEWDGTARTIMALPQPAPEIERPRYVEPPPSLFLGECLVGMEVAPGELCVYPGSLCAFDVATDGMGHFLTMFDAERIEANEVINGELTYNFVAEWSERVWTIQNAPPPKRDNFMGERVICPPDQQIAGLADAIWRHDIARVQRLIDSGANVNALQEHGWRLLEYAVIYSDNYESTEIVERLIDAGADVNAISAYGAPILRSAAGDETIDALKLLLDAGADPNARDRFGGPILDRAIGAEAEDAVRLLVEAGADIDALDYRGDPMLVSPLIFGKGEIIQVLVDLGADVHALGRFGKPLLFAALGEGTEMMQLMLDAGADPNTRSSSGKPILSSIAESEHPDLVRLLLDAGADPNACDWGGGWAPLFHAIRYGHVENVRVLVESGANVNAFDGDGDPVLARALLRRSDSMIPILVDAGADVNAIDSDGKTMLELARRVASAEIVQYLIEAGAE